MTGTSTDFDQLVSFENDLEASSKDDDDAEYQGEVITSLADAGIRSEGSSSRAKPWMKYHRFELLRTADQVRDVISHGIEVGNIALDLETEGLDNRISYDAQGKPYTEDKIVGYCLGLQGVGYYAPVRHAFDKYDQNPNVDSVERVEAEITRLCQAAQPVLKPGADILGARERDFEVPPKVVIEFWHAKFDQEFLYPVTGIDIWNPHSFEDGMLMAYVLYTDDDLGLKENARDKLPPAGGEHRYEMIEFTELFPPGMKKRERKFANLVPSEGSDVVYYGCSDGICTNLLCGLLLPKVNANVRFKSFYRLEKQDVQAVRLIERARILINKKEIDVLLQEAETELAHYEAQIKQVAATFGYDADFNPSSSAQLADLLFSPKGLDLNPKPEKTSEGQYKTDEKTIDAYVEEHAERMPVLGHIVKHRQINKVRGTYLKNLAENTDDHDQLRLNFKQTGAATGRFTAPKGDPDQGFGGIPIQGIPARDDPKKPKVAHSLRRMFISRPGYVFVKVDYASQELRIAASVSGEEKWIKEYEKEIITGEAADLHMMTAQAFFPGLTKDSPDVKLKRNAGKCVHPDTLVSALGYAPLSSIATFPTQADEFMAVTGVEVDGHPVTQTYNGGVKPLVHVVSRKGIVTCTEEHRFMGADGELVRAGDLRKGYPLSPIELPSFWAPGPGVEKFKLWRGVPEAIYKLDEDLCYFAGVFLGNGSVSASSARITHGDIDKLDAFDCLYLEWQKLLVDTCQRVGMDVEPAPDNVYLGSRVTVRYLASLGLVVPRPGTEDGRKKHLRVPRWVLNQGPNGFLAFLGGLIDTDGSVAHQQRTIEFTTKDFVFAGQIAAMSQACGLSLSVEATFNRTYERHYARLRFAVESSWKLRQYLRYPGKISRLAPPTNPSKMGDVNDVLMVIPAGDGPCLDITMGTEAHLYRANGMLTHNTANFALVYGGGVGAVQRATGCDEVEASRLKKAFDDSVPQFSKWVKKQHTYVKTHLGVETAFHRFIAIPDAMITGEEINRRRREKGKEELPKFVAAKEAKKIQAACERKATNFPIQGSGADILKISLVLLVREFLMRGWLRNGGDDSVRMVMTVHDEIVFEIREERVAAAVPIIVKIMESPYKLAGWRIPLIAEPDLGYSWAAKINWHKMMKGEEDRPAYLQGAEITSDPDVLVLRPETSPKGPPSTPPAPKTPPPAVAAPAPRQRSNDSNGQHTAARPPEVAPRASSAPGRFLSVRLRMIHVDHPTVCNIARACTDARIEAIKQRKSDVMVPVEFLLGTGQVVYSRKQGYKVEPEELLAGLRRLNLLEAYDMKDNYE